MKLRGLAIAVGLAAFSAVPWTMAQTPVSYTHLDVYKRQLHANVVGELNRGTQTPERRHVRAADVLSLIHIFASSDSGPARYSQPTTPYS